MPTNARKTSSRPTTARPTFCEDSPDAGATSARPLVDTDTNEPGLAAGSEPPSVVRAWADDDVAAYLGISQRQLLKLLGTPDFPEPQRLGGRRQGRRWNASDVMAWVSDPERQRLAAAARLGPRGVAMRI